MHESQAGRASETSVGVPVGTPVGTPVSTAETLAAVGPRLRALRQNRGVTLTDLAEATGISVSTLSRLESGQRRATLQLLLPLAQAHRVPLDDLVGAPPTGDPRVHLKPVERHGRTYVPLTQMPGPLQAFKLVIRPGQSRAEPNPRAHEGFEWLYVLSGRLRLVLGEHDVVMGSGEAAEFDTRVPHWFACADDRPVECLCLFGKQGERVHLTARPRR